MQFHDPDALTDRLELLLEDPASPAELVLAARRARRAWQRGDYSAAASALRKAADEAAELDGCGAWRIRRAFFDALEGLEALEALETD